MQAIVCVNCHVRMPTVFRNNSFDVICGAIYTFDSLAGGCTRMFSALFFPPLFSPRCRLYYSNSRCFIPNATLFEYSLIFREDKCNCLETVVPNLSYFTTEPSIQVEHALNFGTRNQYRVTAPRGISIFHSAPVQWDITISKLKKKNFFFFRSFCTACNFFSLILYGNRIIY